MSDKSKKQPINKDALKNKTGGAAATNPGHGVLGNAAGSSRVRA